MAAIKHRNFDKADVTRTFEDGKGRLDLLSTEQGPVGRAVFEPGWQWTKHVKPIAGTATCLASHVGYVVSGRMKVVMNDGEADELSAGDFFTVQPGHDAWVVGDETCVILDWVGFGDYAVPAGS
ncbi:cupin domain-containing protein [Streptomyces sp. NPDC051907]|uniref:cupin domain-containing protein n=1 Tax=Streptomyces sp. NPDC051907 TaxID=3155284 RepID=UPI00342D67C0